MRRLLPFLVLVTLVSAMYAGVAWARTGVLPGAEPSASTGEATGPHAPFHVPSTAVPTRDVTSKGPVYGFVTSERLGAVLAAEEREAAGAPAPTAPGTITVTARVLPAVTIQLDADGNVASLLTNTPDRDASRVLFSIPGGTLDTATWTQVRVALAAARAGTGTVWTR